MVLHAKTAYAKSVTLLSRLSTKSGFLASLVTESNYPRVWARDGVIAGIASLMTGNPELIATFLRTLQTLKEGQDHTGRIPSNIDHIQGGISYGSTVGRIDATLWYVVGVTQYILRTGEAEQLIFFEESLKKALFYLECLELNGRGFVYIPPGGDWADEYVNAGYVLYDEVLYYLALKGAGSVFEDKKLQEKAEYLKNMIQVNFLPKEENQGSEFIFHKRMFEMTLEAKVPYPLSFISNVGVGTHFDTFGISLSIISGLLSDSEIESVANTLEQYATSANKILPAFIPVIEKGTCEWDDLVKNHLYEFRNVPHEYHNGGRWPLVHGWFLGAVPFAFGGAETMAEVFDAEGYTFPEFYHGQSGVPRGVTQLGFSASAFIIAHQKEQGIEVFV
ncbi:MAG: hypothetical protein WDZ88_03240 [Candidatus Paceibacterota bacterium]